MKPKRFLITGCNGQVGFELQRSLAPMGEVVALDRQAMNLADPDSIRQAIQTYRPDVIVNPAAYTAVDKAESDRETAHAVNGVAPGIIGVEAAKIGALVIHYSTDYVYDGSKVGPYLETDATHPLGVYGQTKLAGELALAESGAKHLIFRTSWVFGTHGANFLKTILRLASERDELKIVADQFGAPTSAGLIAEVTSQVLGSYGSESERDTFPLGTYHLAAAGTTSWHEYARYVVRQATAAGLNLRATPETIHPIPAAAYPMPASRPMNSTLDTRRLRNRFNLDLPPWQTGVNAVLQALIQETQSTPRY
jgi:dTDP-4-dehydrorhamnose reductase